MVSDVDINSKEFLDFYNKGGYGDKGWADDFFYGFNLLNLFNGDVAGNSPSIKKAKQDYIEQLMAQDRINFNQGFEDLFNSGASGDDLMRYVLEHPDVQYDSNIVQSMINTRMSDESWSRNLKNMKEAGINPLVGFGNVGSLGSTPDISLDNAVAKANAGNNAGNGYNSDLANIKNILLILLAMGKLAK